jgi:hypothetical protein
MLDMCYADDNFIPTSWVECAIFSNFDLPKSIMPGLLTGIAGNINGTDPAAPNTNRVGTGTGVFTLGSPREIEFRLKIAF